MRVELWLAFVAAYTVISVIPGPSVFMVIGQALTRGTSAAFLCIIGDVLGGIVLMCLSFLGMGAILATSVLLFQTMKWAGVFYMAWLGCLQIAEARKGPSPGLNKSEQSCPSASLSAGFFVGILNPKAIVFYMALLSQFIDPGRDPLPQFLILMATSTTIVVIVLSGYALTAVCARNALQSASARRRLGYAGGSCLLGGSVMIAATR